MSIFTTTQLSFRMCKPSEGQKKVGAAGVCGLTSACAHIHELETVRKEAKFRTRILLHEKKSLEQVVV